MVTIHAQLHGEKALLQRQDLERLLALAQRAEAVELCIDDEDVSAADMMRLAERGGSFEFWHEAGEDIYSATDGEPV
jgi:hypothetical protein